MRLISSKIPTKMFYITLIICLNACAAQDSTDEVTSFDHNVNDGEAEGVDPSNEGEMSPQSIDSEQPPNADDMHDIIDMNESSSGGEESSMVDETNIERVRCRPLSSRTESIANGQTTLIHQSYAWRDETATISGDYEGSATYNAHGLVLEQSMNYGNGVYSELSMSYDCDVWCRPMTSLTETTSNGQTTIIDQSYVWDGNTAMISGSYSGSATYNDRGYILQQNMSYGEGISSEFSMTYDCGSWCRPMISHTESRSNGQMTIIDQRYEWDGDRATISGTYSGSATYNAHGYLLEQTMSYGSGVSSEFSMAYECSW